MYTMKLQEKYYNYIKFGDKKFEIRLNDEKRRHIKKGDFIEFQKEPDRKEKIILKVLDIYRFLNFKDLLDNININYLASSEVLRTKLFDDLNCFYPADKQKNGVLAIELNKNIIVNKAKIMTIGIDDEIFNRLRKCYYNFDYWLKKIQNEECFYTEKNGKVSSILILKIDEKDSTQFFEEGKIMKIRTFLVDDVLKGIGSFYMEIVDDIARENDIKYIYLTIKKENEKMIDFVKKFNYKNYSDIYDEYVYYKELK